MSVCIESDAIKVNRIGYLPGARKEAFFRMDYPETAFSVIDSEGNAVFHGEISRMIENKAAGEWTGMGDFSPLSVCGGYRIKTESLGISEEFHIDGAVYHDVFRDLNRMFYLHRCGIELETRFAGDFAHAACHCSVARALDSGEKREVNGGWHDAGDYGRYVVPAAKAVMDLLMAYCCAPDAFTDDTGIPESTNGIADILDEVRFELEWMLAMQREDGGVYHKVTCAQFPGFIMPEHETDELLLSSVSTCATADFCGTVALAVRVFETIDPVFAKTCLHAAEHAFAFLEKTTFECFNNPAGIETGQYEDIDDKDERYFAACSLLHTTGEMRYADTARKLADPVFADGLGWEDMGAYGNALYLMTDKRKTDPSLRRRIQQDLLCAADQLVLRGEKDGYYNSLTVYRWGSNMYLMNNAMLLLMANDVRPSAAYTRLVASHVNYIFGSNPMSTSFVTGHGDACPLHPHHRPSVARNQPMPGMLVGGPDERLEDECARELLAGAPPARCYVDQQGSYSTNEVAIYWNSPLIYVLARLNWC